MRWFLSLVWGLLPNLTPPEDSRQVAEREAELRRRFDRLSQEVDVVQRIRPGGEDGDE